MTATVVRAQDLLWRVAPDCILVRRLDDPGDAILELVGGAALVWLALDEPRTVAELAAGFDVEADNVRQALDALAAQGLVREA